MPARPNRAARAAIAKSLADRYGPGVDKARFQPPPSMPTGDVIGHRPPPPSVPTTSVPSFRDLPRPPAWVRAHASLTYGITPTAQQEFTALGANDAERYTNFVEAQLNWETIDDSAVEARLTAGGFTTLSKTLAQLWLDHVVNAADYNVRMRPAWEVQRASLVRAMYSKRQLRELLITFWHDHFNVQATDYDAGPVYVHYDRQVMRAHAMGNFRNMLESMTRSTSMMYYLDNRSNTRAGPNENFGRELLELHTMGAENYLGFVYPADVPPCPEDPAYPIGYTDLDVYDTAACFTGWTVNTGTGGDGTFVYRSANHDSGSKYVLGLFLPPAQADMKDGHDVMDRLASHPRVARFICRKLIRRFVTDNPSQALVDSAALVFRQNWQNADQIRLTLRHILLSNDARETWGEKVRRPSETLVATMRALSVDWTIRIDDSRSNDFMYRLGFTGHVPYDWPAPNGYPDVSATWTGANGFAMTWKMQNWLTETRFGDGTTPFVAPILDITRAGLPVAQWTATNLADFWCLRLLGYLPLASRRQALVKFMAQNGNATTDVIADTDTWSGGDLKKHYNHQRLRSMVSLILMSPEFVSR